MPTPNKNSVSSKIMIIMVILIPIALFNGPINMIYTIQSDKVENDFTIAVIADLHNQYFGEDQEDIITLLEKRDPDIILMPGDMTNSAGSVSAMVSMMEQAVAMAPTYYVLGNHEYWSGECEEICDIVSAAGVTVLRSEMITLDINGNVVELYGMDDVEADRYDPAYAEHSWGERLHNLWTDNLAGNYRILMTHRPERAEIYADYEYDLVTAGHSHGGQVRIPFILNGLYAPDQGWFPKYAGGDYWLNNTTLMIVSRGLYTYKWMPRIFNPSEVVIIHVKAVDSE